VETIEGRSRSADAPEKESEMKREWNRNRERSPRFTWLPAAPALALLVALGAFLAPTLSSAVEIVPSYGFTKSQGADDVKGMYGLALRGSLIPDVLQTEIGAAYRTDERNAGALDVRQWPITASLYLTPLNMVYAGVGVGWYHTTYDYESDLIEDETTQDFGVHVGGGLKVPVAPRVAVDLSGRWVQLQDQESRLVPEKFDPSFWTLSAGLALKF
jgi:opacity protein-like surface antigen